VPVSREVLAGLIFAVTLAAIVVRPRRLDEGLAAATGTALMILVGVLSPTAALSTLAGEWNVFLFFAGLMLIAAVADQSGFFDWAGALAAACAGGSARRLLVSVFIVGSLITTFLSNDATALILTPVVYAIVTKLRLPVLPYLFATTFIADTASMTLPMSNPVNVIVASRAGISLGTYLPHLALASVVAIVINLGVFLLVFRRETAGRFVLNWRAAIAEAIPEPQLFRLVLVLLFAISVAYVAASAVNFPLGVVAIGGGLALAFAAIAFHNFSLRRLGAHFSPSLFVYVAGLFVLVSGVESSGLTGTLVSGLARLITSSTSAVVAGVIGTGVGSNLINNFPAVLVMLSGVQSSHMAPQLQLPFLMGSLAGADLGPNLTPVGSLSTMLWLIIVRRRGVDISSLDYLKVGLVVTPAMLVGAALVIVLTFR
jgi:arsenical pump membrane protein